MSIIHRDLQRREDERRRIPTLVGELVREAVARANGERPFPATWWTENTWITCHEIGDWTIGPDEPATLEDVERLLEQSDSKLELFS